VRWKNASVLIRLESAASEGFAAAADGRLHGAFGPAVGLLLEADHFRRKLSRGAELRKVDELPALDLSAVAEVEIFSERVVLPPAGVVDGRSAPDAGRPVEVHEPSAAVAGGVLDDEVPVEKIAWLWSTARRFG